MMQHRTERGTLQKVDISDADQGRDGILIVDECFRPIAMDGGAQAILCRFNPPDYSPEYFRLPQEVLSDLGAPPGGNPHGISKRVSIGECEYVFRVFCVRSLGDAAVRPRLAIYVKREQSIADTVIHAGHDYRLTDREQQALIGMTMGLTSKELAEQMKISPNTVKAYLRLIMIKMGVTTRAGIVGKLLDQNNRVNVKGA